MERTLKLRNAVTFIVGIVIGSGIFASPGFVIAEVGSPGASLCVWAVCGLLTTMGSLSMAELSAALPSSGGEAVYLTRAFHPLCGFWYTFVTAALAKPCGCALISIVFSDYVCRLRWSCNEFAPEDEPCEVVPEWVRKTVALAAVWFLASVQAVSTSAATAVQGFFTVEKLVLVLTLCVLGVANAATPGGLARFPYTPNNSTSHRNALSPEHSFEGTNFNVANWALAVMNCLFAYNGWNNINLSAGEVLNPGWVFPRASIISLPLITVAYVWLNAAYLVTLPIDEMKGAQTIAVDFAIAIGGSALGKAVGVGVALSAFGALNGSLFGASRLVHAMGNSGTLPSFFGGEVTVFGRQTPIVGIASQASVVTVLVLAVGTFRTIVRIYIFAQWWFYLSTIVGLLYLRYTEPDLKRPFRVPSAVPIMFVMASAFVCGVLLWQSPVECGVSAAVLAAGTPIYFLQHRERRRGAQSLNSNSGADSEATPLLAADQDRRAKSPWTVRPDEKFVRA